MIKNKPFFLPRALSFIIIIILLFPLLSPYASGSPAGTADSAPAVLSDAILTSVETLKPFLETIYQQSLDRGIKNYYPYSFALIRECYTALDTGQYDKALLLSEYAEQLAPDLSAATAARAQSRWVRNKLFFHHLIWGQLTSFCKQLYEFEPPARFLAAAMLSLAGAFLLTLALFCLTLLAKYLPRAYHDLKHIFPLSMPHAVSLGWALFIFCVPLLFNFSLCWVLCYWLLLMFSYQNKQEQKATICLILFLSLIPQFLAGAATMLTAPQSPLIKTLWTANYGSWQDRDADYLKSYSEAHPEDTASLFTLGLISKKEGDYKKAERYYQKVLERNPQHPLARSNLGNVYCAIKKPDQAIEQYQQALALKPSSAAAHFNLSRAYLQKFMFTESEAEFMKAKHLDSSAVTYLLVTYAENPNRLLIDEPLPRLEIWQQAFSAASENRLLAQQLWDVTCRGIPFAYGWAAPGAFIICALLVAKNKRFALAKRCMTCGRSFCRRCERVSAQTRSCTQCTNILGKQEGLDPALKEMKMLTINKYRGRQQTITTFFTFLFPGAGLMRKGYPVPGLLCTVLFAFFLFFTVLHGFVMTYSWDITLPPAPGLSRIGLGFILLCGVVVIGAAHRRKELDMTAGTPAAAAKKHSAPHRKAAIVKG